MDRAACTRAGKFLRKAACSSPIGFRMAGTRHQLAPAMTSQQPINRPLVDAMADSGFEGLLDLGNGGQFAQLGARHKGLQQGPFLRERQIGMPTPACAWRLGGPLALAVVAGNHTSDGPHRDAGLPGYLSGCARGKQGVVNNPPTLAHPKAWLPCASAAGLLRERDEGQLASLVCPCCSSPAAGILSLKRRCETSPQE